MREDTMKQQVADAVTSVSVPADWTDWMLGELTAEQALEAGEQERQLVAVSQERRQIDQKLDRLLTAHYRSAKARLVTEKQQSMEKTKALTLKHGNRFEPVTRFVKALRQAALLSSGTDDIKKRDFLRKNSSNLILRTRQLQWEQAERGKPLRIMAHLPISPPRRPLPARRLLVKLVPCSY